MSSGKVKAMPHCLQADSMWHSSQLPRPEYVLSEDCLNESRKFVILQALSSSCLTMTLGKREGEMRLIGAEVKVKMANIQRGTTIQNRQVRTLMEMKSYSWI